MIHFGSSENKFPQSSSHRIIRHSKNSWRLYLYRWITSLTNPRADIIERARVNCQSASLQFLQVMDSSVIPLKGSPHCSHQGGEVLKTRVRHFRHAKPSAAPAHDSPHTWQSSGKARPLNGSIRLRIFFIASDYIPKHEGEQGSGRPTIADLPVTPKYGGEFGC